MRSAEKKGNGSWAFVHFRSFPLLFGALFWYFFYVTADPLPITRDSKLPGGPPSGSESKGTPRAANPLHLGQKRPPPSQSAEPFYFSKQGNWEKAEERPVTAPPERDARTSIREAPILANCNGSGKKKRAAERALPL